MTTTRPGPLAHARLWLSYQRYGLVLVLGGAALAGLAVVALPWWLALAAVLLLAWPASFGVQVLGRWPRKLRATIVAQRRIDAGRFRPASVRGHCGDPCFRVVAGEILARAGVDRAGRRQIIAEHRAALRRERDQLIVFDHARGVVVTVIDGQRTERPLGRPRDAGPQTAG